LVLGPKGLRGDFCFLGDFEISADGLKYCKGGLNMTPGGNSVGFTFPNEGVDLKPNGTTTVRISDLAFSMSKDGFDLIVRLTQASINKNGLTMCAGGITANVEAMRIGAVRFVCHPRVVRGRGGSSSHTPARRMNYPVDDRIDQNTGRVVDIDRRVVSARALPGPQAAEGDGRTWRDGRDGTQLASASENVTIGEGVCRGPVLVLFGW